MDFFTNLVYQYGLFAMFFLILIEYACFPISSEIVLPFSGAVASLQHIPFFFVLPVSVAAGLIGTSICYAIGYWGGAHLIEKITNRFPKSKKGIDASCRKFDKNGSKAVCLGRLIPICRTYIAFAAGIAKQKFSLFLTASFIGISIWNFILIGFGYYLRENWNLVEQYYKDYKTIFLIAIFVVIIIFFLKKYLSKKEKI